MQMLLRPFNRTLSQAFNPKKNSLGFLRSVLAVLVVVEHTYILGEFGLEPLTKLSDGQISSGALAVHSFFVISGFLITYSYLRTQNFWRYLWHRLLRIFPGFWVCLGVIAFIIAPVIYRAEHGNLNGYWTTNTDNPFSYIIQNITLHIKQPDIAGLMSAHAEKSLDGSLWTLEWEFILYLLIGFLGLSTILKKFRLVTLLIFIAFLATYLFDPCHCTLLWFYYTAGRVASLPVLFMVGAIFWLYREKIYFDFRIFLLAVLISLVAIQFKFYLWVEPFALPYIILWLAVTFPLDWFDKYGDYSYGIYIYSFPIQQALVQFGFQELGAIIYFIFSLILTMPFAILSWHYIEQPSLRLKSIEAGATLLSIQEILKIRTKSRSSAKG